MVHQTGPKSGQKITPPSPSSPRPKIGLALGSGAARGWGHVGVLRALDELGVKIDVYAGCSAGAIVSGAHLLGILDDVRQWAQSIGPISVVGNFAFKLARGGLIDPSRAFERFAAHDQQIEDLPAAWGAVATDLATGQEVWLTNGSCLAAARASSAVPMVLQAQAYPTPFGDRWMVDGAIANPVPVNLARALGADRVIAVDVNTATMTLSRFDYPTTREVVPVTTDENLVPKPACWQDQVKAFVRDQSNDLTQRRLMAKARATAQPQFLETLTATLGIMQAQLGEARAKTDVADVRLTPDLSFASGAAFDQADAFAEVGYQATMAQRDDLEALMTA